MSVENKLKERLKLQEEDTVTFVSDLYQSYVASRVLSPPLLKCHMDGNIIIKRQNGRMGMYTKNGEVVIPEYEHKCWPEFYYSEYYHCEVICLERDGLVEVYSYDGKKQIIPREFKKVILDGWGIKASKNGWDSWTAYSYQGEIIFKEEVISSQVIEFCDKFAFICYNKDELSGVYDWDGREIIPFGRHYIRFIKPFFEVTNKDTKKLELYTFKGNKLPLEDEDKFEWTVNMTAPFFANREFGANFIMGFKNGKRSTLYDFAGGKIIPELNKYAKMYLENQYIICIGKNLVTMDVYDFFGNRIVKYRP